ncbi:MAG: DUF4403 family protein [Moraxellaceae bacterium]|nr:DUF4403 family protein [Moraxellaceae bacterium]
MKLYMRYAVLTVSVLLTACQAPKSLLAPPNNPNPVVLPQVPTSVINLPISIDLETVRSEILKNVPKPLSSGKITQILTIANTSLPMESDISHVVNLRDVKISVIGQDFVATTQLDFSIETKTRAGFLNMGGVSCGVGEELPKIEFSLPGKLYWTTTGDLAVQTGQWQLKWLKPCNITAFKFNVEKMVNLPVIREKVQKIVNENINAAFKQVGFKSLLTQVWPAMNEPKLLEKDVWLLLQPERIGLTDIVGTGRYLKTNLSLTARPQIVTGDKPRVVMPIMPAPQRLITSGDSFYVAFRGDIRLDTANRLLNEQLANKPFDAGGKTVLINSLQLYGSGDKAVLGLRLQQPINAEIFLLGKLVLDANKNEMRLDDIEFELATTSLLAKSANWMLHGTFKNAIAQKARFSFDKDMSNVLADFKDYRQSLGYGATLKAQIAQVRPQGVFFTTNDIKAFVIVEGKLALEVNQNQ